MMSASSSRHASLRARVHGRERSKDPCIVKIRKAYFILIALQLGFAVAVAILMRWDVPAPTQGKTPLLSRFLPYACALIFTTHFYILLSHFAVPKIYRRWMIILIWIFTFAFWLGVTIRLAEKTGRFAIVEAYNGDSHHDTSTDRRNFTNPIYGPDAPGKGGVQVSGDDDAVASVYPGFDKNVRESSPTTLSWTNAPGQISHTNGSVEFQPTATPTKTKTMKATLIKSQNGEPVKFERTVSSSPSTFATAFLPPRIDGPTDPHKAAPSVEIVSIKAALIRSQDGESMNAEIAVSGVSEVPGITQSTGGQTPSATSPPSLRTTPSPHAVLVSHTSPSWSSEDSSTPSTPLSSLIIPPMKIVGILPSSPNHHQRQENFQSQNPAQETAQNSNQDPIGGQAPASPEFLDLLANSQWQSLVLYPRLKIATGLSATVAILAAICGLLYGSAMKRRAAELLDHEGPPKPGSAMVDVERAGYAEQQRGLQRQTGKGKGKASVGQLTGDACRDEAAERMDYYLGGVEADDRRAGAI